MTVTRMPIETLEDLFLAELRDLYDTEHRLTTALDTLAQATTQDDIEEAFAEHEGETMDHVERLESVFASLDAEPEREECEGIEGIIEESEEFIEEKEPSEKVTNRYAIAAAQKAERYEITAYENLVQWAQEARMDESIVDALEANLEDERVALQKLQSLAEEFDHQALVA